MMTFDNPDITKHLKVQIIRSLNDLAALYLQSPHYAIASKEEKETAHKNITTTIDCIEKLLEHKDMLRLFGIVFSAGELHRQNITPQEIQTTNEIFEKAGYNPTPNPTPKETKYAY